ncbi:MAG: Fic family protein [Actinomycetota bacterium]
MAELLPYADDDEIVGLCQELDLWRGLLDRRGVLPRRWLGRLRRDLEAEAVAASTSMEGVPVTVDGVRRILAGDQPPEVEPEDRELVEGYREAMSYVLRRADDDAFRWNRELVAGIHDRVLAGRHSLGAGRLRADRPAFVVNQLTGEQVFLPPPGEDVASLVDEACGRMDGGHPHPALGAAWIHVAVAAIHPFRDGNGRVARVLSSLAMCRGGFTRTEFTSLEEWWGRHRADYYAAFECLGSEFDPGVDVTAFIRAHLEAQLSQVRDLDARERVEREVWAALEEVAEDRTLHRRVSNALWDAFLGREVTAGYYRSLSDVSAPTATKDLGGAVAAGLLAPKGQRRGRRYLADPRLYEAVAETLFIEVSGPPEAARDRITSELARRLTFSGEAFGFPRRPFSGEGPEVSGGRPRHG